VVGQIVYKYKIHNIIYLPIILFFVRKLTCVRECVCVCVCVCKRSGQVTKTEKENDKDICPPVHVYNIIHCIYIYIVVRETVKGDGYWVDRSIRRERVRERTSGERRRWGCATATDSQTTDPWHAVYPRLQRVWGPALVAVLFACRA